MKILDDIKTFLNFKGLPKEKVMRRIAIIWLCLLIGSVGLGMAGTLMFLLWTVLPWWMLIIFILTSTAFIILGSLDENYR